VLAVVVVEQTSQQRPQEDPAVAHLEVLGFFGLKF
jgi:hypothetical protein